MPDVEQLLSQYIAEHRGGGTADPPEYLDRLKVEGYYHEMEQGLLPSAGVSSRVLEALGEIVGASAQFLREVGEPLGTGRGTLEEGAVYARRAHPDERFEEVDALAPPRSPGTG